MQLEADGSLQNLVVYQWYQLLRARRLHLFRGVGLVLMQSLQVHRDGSILWKMGLLLRVENLNAVPWTSPSPL